MTRIPLMRLLASGLCLFLLPGCGGGGGSSAPQAPGSIEITGVPTYASQEGMSGGSDAWVQVARHNYDGPITLSLSGFPARGITGATVPIPAGQNSGLCRVGIDRCVTAGTYPITIYGSGPGIPSVSATSSFTQHAGTPDAAIHAVADCLSLDPGSSVSLRILVSRLGGFTDPLAFSASGLPAGVTAQFAKIPGATDDMMLTLSAASSTAAGSYTMDGQVSAPSWSTPRHPVSIPFVVTGASAVSRRIELGGGPFLVAQGKSIDIAVHIRHFGGDTAPLTLDVATPFFGMPLPLGLDVSFPSGAYFAQDGTLRLTADPHMTPGTYFLQIFSDAQTITAFELTVTPA